MTEGVHRSDGPRPPEGQIPAHPQPVIHADSSLCRTSPAPSTQGADGVQANPADADLAIHKSAQTEHWRIHFADERSPGGWSEGRLQHNPTSRWMGLINLDNDVLVGDYLAADVWITVGSRLHIDIYDVRVDCRMQGDQKEVADLIDLTDTPKAGRSDHRFGGRFWVLADINDEEDQGADHRGGGRRWGRHESEDHGNSGVCDDDDADGMFTWHRSSPEERVSKEATDMHETVDWTDPEDYLQSYHMDLYVVLTHSYGI
ncbi:uncharacterized protein LOC119300761 [Triticum dicoccoides]|uniref:uncharacterized protein LOC119300761 n=1 Tax=Triticum dicoccoides TaxID=85692 RepID=UPI00188E9B1B|nr:uncharacterized protein LOC119300761 [Triticum dicoccoides]